jgi:hypothetical protein
MQYSDTSQQITPVLKFKTAQHIPMAPSAADKAHSITALHLLAYQSEPGTSYEEVGGQMMHEATFSILAGFKNGGCLELKAGLTSNKAPELFVRMYTVNATVLINQYTEFKKSDLSIVGDFKVGRFLEIIEDGSNFTGLAALDPMSNAAGLEVLMEAAKAFKTHGTISDDGTAGFFTPLKQELVLKKGSNANTSNNYFFKGTA